MASWITNATGFAVWSRQWDPATEMPDLSGRVAIVTGGNTGIGLVSAEWLVKAGATVYIACRSEERAQGAIKKLNELVPDAASKVKFLPFDLTDLGSAERAAEAFNKQESRLDIFLGNAGIMAWPYEIKNGLEIQMWNHLGHFALVHHLLPTIKETAKKPDAHVRIVNVSSLAHKWAGSCDFSSIEAVNREMSSTWARYGQSKVANVLFSNALQRRVPDNVRCLSLHPGNINTELTRGPATSYGFLGRLMGYFAQYLAMTPFEGAKTQLYAATSPEVDQLDLKGAYLMPIATVEQPTKLAQDEKVQEQLWSWSEKALKELRPLAPTAA